MASVKEQEAVRSSPRNSDIATERGDLVKRLFAVAISIGFGSAVVTSGWVKSGSFPNAHEWKQIATVGVALCATILSWDGYLVSIRSKPLNGNFRYAIDVILVFCYMFLFVTSAHTSFWLPIICFMFLLYVVWDAATVIEFPEKYHNNPRLGLSLIKDVYIGGVFGRPEVYSGPIITIIWGLFFGVLAILYGTVQMNHFVACLIAAAALNFYRRDKGTTNAGVRGFRPLPRLSLVLILVLLATTSRCLPVFPLG